MKALSKSIALFLLVPGVLFADSDEFFENRIRPVLVKYCYECHSSDAKVVKGGLVLDSRNGWVRGGDTGPAIVPGDAGNSLLMQAISWKNRDLQMPPENALPPEVLEDFRQWITSGALDPRHAKPTLRTNDFNLAERAESHWAWHAVTADHSYDSIDGYLSAHLRHKEFRPAAGAQARPLIRRIYFDLTGLPPTPADIDAFVLATESNRSQAIAQLVDLLLRSPEFGEHWATHWLDVVRFSETKGHVTDQERPFAWKYRDYVIDALNDDLPYDRFVVEHLAGDLLPESEQRPGHRGETNVSPTATGALFMHEMHFMAVDPVRQRWDEINAQVDVVGKAFLALTTECARCHDHKFDAISQKDYYALAGFFASTEQGTARVAARQIHSERQQEIAQKEAAYRSFLEDKRRGRQKAQSPKAGGVYFPVSDELGVQSPGDSAKLKKLSQNLAMADPSWAFWVRAAVGVRGRNAPLLIRGDHRNPGPEVPRRFLTALGNHDTSRDPKDRLWLAHRIASPQNPLTARVWVNRIWHHLFGQGIVKTPNNFGNLGDRPSHPQLLDYLAARLVTERWSTKAIIREIVLSKAYQRSTVPHPASAGRQRERDPENRSLSHQNVRRLTAEQLRDALLHTAGVLDSSKYGPGIDCFVPPYATANKPSNIPASGAIHGEHRRSVYLKVRRNFFDPFLLTFDFPDRGRSHGRRPVTTAPGQALAMLNSPLVHYVADRWGESLATRNDSRADRIAHIWLTALGRSPSQDELESMCQLYDQLNTPGASAGEVWKDMAHVVFNHAEFLWLN